MKVNFDFIKNMKKEHKIIIALVAVILLILLILLILSPSKQNIEFSATSTLKEIKEISDLDTIQYTYNGVARKYTDKSKKKIKYYVAYEGIVNAGFDIEKIKLEVDESKKELIVTLPEIKINSSTVNEETLEFIFTDSKYNTEKVIVDGYNLCRDDLKEKTKNSELIFKSARENAEIEMKAFYGPWLKELDNDYKLVIK